MPYIPIATPGAAKNSLSARLLRQIDGKRRVGHSPRMDAIRLIRLLIGPREERRRGWGWLLFAPEVKEQLELFFKVPRIIQDLDSNNFDDIYSSWRHLTKFAPWILTGVFYLSDIDPFPHMHTIIESTFSNILPIKK